MDSAKRIVIGMPLGEIWDLRGRLESRRLRVVGKGDIEMLVRAGRVRFVVAECGETLNWIPVGIVKAFWEREVKGHLVEPEGAEGGFSLDDFPGEYCFVASEWSGSVPIVLLEMHH